MLDNLKWLAKTEEIEFEKTKFHGKLAGKAWKYSRNLSGLIRTRAIIFLMAILVFFPVLTNYLFHDIFYPELLIERAIYSVIFITSGILFNKLRILSIILASLPIILILTTYLLILKQFDYKVIGFLAAILFLILSGIYHNYRLKIIKRELDNSFKDSN